MYNVRIQKQDPSPLVGSCQTTASFIRVQRDIISLLGPYKSSQYDSIFGKYNERETANSIQRFSLPPMQAGALGDTHLLVCLLMKRGLFQGNYFEVEIVFPLNYPYAPPTIFLKSSDRAKNHDSINPSTKQILFNYITSQCWLPIHEYPFPL